MRLARRGTAEDFRKLRRGLALVGKSTDEIPDPINDLWSPIDSYTRFCLKPLENILYSQELVNIMRPYTESD